ncbi:unnamed protein product [Amoebophrya sp. A120]|nr:unnamed protein product [Amoebophrya sp. A120]|eukprot:GSA120T00007818001.1
MSILKHIDILKQEWRIVLASSSPRRKEILGELQLPFEVITSAVENNMSEEERKTLRNLGAEKYTVELARRKCLAVTGKVLTTPLRSEDDRRKHVLVIASDTCIEQDIIEEDTGDGSCVPEDYDEAALPHDKGKAKQRKAGQDEDGADVLEPPVDPDAHDSTRTTERQTDQKTSKAVEDAAAPGAGATGNTLKIPPSLSQNRTPTRILDKPANPDDAVRTLKTLRGKSHRVVTGVALCWIFANNPHNPDSKDVTVRDLFAETTIVKFRNLSDLAIERYVATGEPLDKAGSYGIQGLGGLLVEGIQGCHRNVIGFPLSAISEKIAGRLDEYTEGRLKMQFNVDVRQPAGASSFSDAAAAY